MFGTSNEYILGAVGSKVGLNAEREFWNSSYFWTLCQEHFCPMIAGNQQRHQHGNLLRNLPRTDKDTTAPKQGEGFAFLERKSEG